MSDALALLSSLTWGVSDYVGGRVTRRASAVAVVLWSQVVGLAFGALGAPLFGGGLQLSWALWGIGAGLGGGLGLVALYQGFAFGRMAVVAPLASVVSAALPVVAGVAAGERPSPSAILGITVAVPALWLVTRSPESSLDPTPVAPSVRLGVMAGVGFGLFFVLLGQVPVEAGLWPLVPARASSVLLMTGLVLMGRGSGTVSRLVIPGVVFAGAGDMLANMLFLSAAQRGLLSTASVLASLYPAVTVALARIFGEAVRGTQWAGVALSLMAVGLITV